MSTLPRSFKSSPARCAAVPVPGDANEYLPGFARTSARNSFRFFAGSDGCTDNTFGMRHSSDIAVKSLAESYGSFVSIPGCTACALLIRPMVWPSAGAWAIAFVPTMPPAPVLYSTNTGWVIVLVISVAMMRASTSVVPPGGDGEMMRIGLVGYCASAVALRTSEAAASASFGAVMRTSLVLQTRRKPVSFNCLLGSFVRQLRHARYSRNIE